MIVAADSVVTFHYSLRVSGEVLDSSFGDEPLAALVGHQNIVPGLEQGMLGKSKGDTFELTVAPDDGYGQRFEHLMQAVPKALFDGVEPQVGMQFRATTEEGERSVVVVGLEGDDVIVDGNHPLAGFELQYDVEIVDVRPATITELEHGHVHSAGGCGHNH